jgi:hypothetical protein
MTEVIKTQKPQGRRQVFVAAFRHWRSGRMIYARDYGRKAFVFYVK